MRAQRLLLSCIVAAGMWLCLSLAMVQAGVQEPGTTAAPEVHPRPAFAAGPQAAPADYSLVNGFFSGMSQYMTSTDFVNYPNGGPGVGPIGCVPIAGVDFDYGPRRNQPGSPIAFTATVTSGLQPVFTWDFADGGTAQGVTAAHTYADANDHLVRLTAANPCQQVVVSHPVYGPGWQVRAILPGHTAAGIPVLAEGGGYYHLAWMQEAPNGEYHIFHAARTLDGDWSEPQQLDEGGGGVAAGSRPAIAAAADGSAHVAWIGAQSSWLVWALVMPGGGMTIRPINANGMSWDPALAVDGPGNVYAAWRQTEPGGSQIYFARYLTAAGFWSERVPVSDFETEQGAPTLVADTAGRAYVAWTGYSADRGAGQVFFSTVDAARDDWTPDDFLTNIRPINPRRGVEQYGVALALASDGTLHAIWRDGRNRQAPDDYWDIYGARLRAGAYTWEAALRINREVAPSDQGAAALAADRRGRTYAAWMESRFLALGSTWGMVSSAAGERTWGEDQRVDVSSPAIPGQWPALASDAFGNLAVVWRGFSEATPPRLFEATMSGPAVLVSASPSSVDNSWGEAAWTGGTTGEVIVVRGENFVSPTVELNGVPLPVQAAGQAVTVTLSRAFPAGVYDLIVWNRGVRASNSLPFTITNRVHHFGIAPLVDQVAGQPFLLTVQAFDKYGLAAPGYTGSAHLTDRTGTLVPATTGAFAAGGTWSGPVTVATATPADVIAVADAGTVGESVPFTVTAAVPALDHFAVDVSLPVTVGVPFTVAVTARDQAGSLLADYAAGNTLAASSGPIMPTQTSNLVGGFWQGRVTVTSAGVMTLATSGGGKAGASAAFTVEPAALDHFAVVVGPATALASGVQAGVPLTQTAGIAFTLAITAADRYGNPARFADMVILADDTGTLTPTVAGPFVNGLWSGAVRILQAGVETTIDVSGAGKTGQSPPVAVQPATVSRYAVTSGSYQRRARRPFPGARGCSGRKRQRRRERRRTGHPVRRHSRLEPCRQCCDARGGPRGDHRHGPDGRPGDHRSRRYAGARGNQPAIHHYAGCARSHCSHAGQREPAGRRDAAVWRGGVRRVRQRHFRCPGRMGSRRGRRRH